MTDNKRRAEASPGGAPVATGMFTRRRLLKTALLGGGGLLAGVGALRLIPAGFDDYGKLQILTRYEADILYRLGDAILPRGDGWPTMREADVIPRMDEELYFLDAALSSDYKAALMLLEAMPLGFGYLGRFSRLDRDDRIGFLRETQKSDSPIVAIVVNAARAMLTYLYYGHPRTWQKIGYDGPFARLPPKLSEQRLHFRKLKGHS